MLGKRSEAAQLSESLYLSLDLKASVVHQIAFPSSENTEPAEVAATQCDLDSSDATFSDRNFEHDLLGITSRRVKFSLSQIKCVFVQLVRLMHEQLPAFPELHGRPDLKSSIQSPFGQRRIGGS